MEPMRRHSGCLYFFFSILLPRVIITCACLYLQRARVIYRVRVQFSVPILTWSYVLPYGTGGSEYGMDPCRMGSDEEALPQIIS